MLKTIVCSGTPYEIGYQHGEQAKAQVLGSIAFYKTIFLQNTKMDWDQVKTVATDFETSIRSKWPAYLDEMQGVADGAGVEILDIVALNVRTEINFGRFSDGCTAMSWTTGKTSYLAQNWDWMEEQKSNLIPLVIRQSSCTIRMVTEAGIIGKIGFNNHGVGVCLNAIRALGLDANKMPCHLGLRKALESKSIGAAVAELERWGIASSCHILVADAFTSIGLEWSAVDLSEMRPNARGQIFHTNHYILEHAPGVVDTAWLTDSPHRLTRAEELSRSLPDEPTPSQIASLFTDTQNGDASICRTQTTETGSATLFNIVMELKSQTASVVFGKPNAPDEVYTFP